MLKVNDTVGIVANSNCLQISDQKTVDDLCRILKKMGLNVIVSPYLYQSDMIKKADFMIQLYKNNNIKAIFDISGGDMANEVIDQLDYKMISQHPKPLFGYSDLTCLLNALYTKTQNKQILYQVKNLVLDNAQIQQKQFHETLIKKQKTLFSFHYHFIKGDEMKGIVVGGNIRCFLKLAGTPYIPNLQNKILFLESLGGKSELIHSHLIHLKLLGIFEQVSGIILGTFTTMEKHHEQPTVENMIIEITKDLHIPIIKTEDIGHASHSKALIIGEYLELKKISHDFHM